MSRYFWICAWIFASTSCTSQITTELGNSNSECRDKSLGDLCDPWTGARCQGQDACPTHDIQNRECRFGASGCSSALKRPGSVVSWHNATFPSDVDGNGHVSQSDLDIILGMIAEGPIEVGSFHPGDDKPDVDADGLVTARDLRLAAVNLGQGQDPRPETSDPPSVDPGDAPDPPSNQDEGYDCGGLNAPRNGLPAFPGDANYDCCVDAKDMDLLGQHWQQKSFAGPSDGDFNNDGMVDAQDLSILGQNWQSCAEDSE